MLINYLKVAFKVLCRRKFYTTVSLFGIAFTRYLNRRLSLPPRLGTLIGVGTSICGVSAIVATGPGIDARDEEVTYAITVITVFGLLAMLVYPYLAHLLFSGDPTAVGLFLGTSVHDTSQVNGAGMIYADAYAAPRALDVAIVTKLVRNVFMVVVIPAMAFAYHRSMSRAGGGGGANVALGKLFPMFVVGFVLVALFRSVGDLGVERAALRNPPPHQPARPRVGGYPPGAFRAGS